MMVMLDHLVHFVNREPMECATEFQEKGLHTVMGGTHEEWGTWNSLFYMGTSYLEFLAVKDKARAAKSANPLIQQLLYDLGEGNEGLGQICFRTEVNGIGDFKKKLEGELGFKTELFEGRRKTATGDWLQWKMLFITQKIDKRLQYPFFIEWEQEDEGRFSALEKQGIKAPKHRNVVPQEIVFVVEDAELASRNWSTVLGSGAVQLNKELLLPFEKTGTRWSVTHGETTFIFVEPGVNEELNAILKQRGERPVGVKLFSEQKSGQGFWGCKYY